MPLHFFSALTRPMLAACIVGATFFFAGCAGPEPYSYEYREGRTAELYNGFAVAPAEAPPEVVAAIAAGNEIAGLPYRRGGGHGNGPDTAYDCSGAVSHVLRSAGLLKGSTTSKGFRKYGERGRGKWITVYARRDHVFLVVAGLRFDTGWTKETEGPRWTTRSRTAKGSVLRHPDGL